MYSIPLATLTVRPVRLEPPQYFWFPNRGHFLKSTKYAIKINPKKSTPLEPHQYFRACVATAQFSNLMDFRSKNALLIVVRISRQLISKQNLSFSNLSTMQSVISNSSFIIFEQKKLSVVLFENANLDRGIVQIMEVSWFISNYGRSFRNSDNHIIKSFES